MTRYPLAFGHLACALDFSLAEVREIALVGPDLAPLLDVVRASFRPHIVLAAASAPDGSVVPLLRERQPIDGRATAYVCERFACLAPVGDPQALAALL